MDKMKKDEIIQEIRKCFGMNEISDVRQTTLEEFERDEIFKEKDLEEVIQDEIGRIANLIRNGGTLMPEDADKFRAALDFEDVRDKDEYGY